MAISEAVFAIRRSALRACASGDSSHPSGSKADAAETDVRSIDMGDVCSARVLISCTWNGWRSRSPASDAATLLELRRGGELQMMEEVDDLLVRGMLGQVLIS